MVGGTIPPGEAFPTSGVRISLPEVVVFSGGSTGPGMSSKHLDEVILRVTGFVFLSGEARCSR